MGIIYQRLLFATTIVTALTLSACGGGGGGTPAPKSVNISWAANNEKAVNTAGGGYKVYHSQNSAFGITDPSVSTVDIPYTSGSLAPTTTTLTLAVGTHYVRVAAYSSLNAPASTGGSQSVASAQITVSVQ
ncbi:hypothetical protein JYT31_00970 [Beggiatoa alba]|nr:hypothetical protein [Beggiatoa alba]